MTAFEILNFLCDRDGISGVEEGASKAAARLLSDITKCKIDHMGNVTGTMGSGEKHILLDAHIDQIGMRVMSVDEKGFIRVGACGGVDVRTLPGAQVIIYGKRTVTGIVCCQPPHLQKGSFDTLPALDELYIDTGLSGKEAAEIIWPGCAVALKSNYKRLAGGRICTKSADNRAGIAALLLCAKALAEKELPCRVSFLFSAQEETGERGAKISAFDLEPDEAIAVDVSFDMTPGCPENKCGVMGKGPMIGISPVLSGELTDRLKDLAKEKSIDYQLEIMSEATGTNADVIAATRGGVKCGLVSIPIKNMHTPVEIVQESDIIETARLLEYFVLNGGVTNA